MSIYENIKVSINKNHSEYLNEYIDAEVYNQKFELKCTELENELDLLDDNKRINHFQKSLLNRVIKVSNRLLLIRDLINQLKTSANPTQMSTYPGLITYLLLTCFDQLGQDEKGYRFFPHWLKSSKTKEERDEILDNVLKEENPLDEHGNPNLNYIEKIFDNYHKIYGNKNSFMYFIDNLLSETDRNELFHQVKIETTISDKEQMTISRETNDDVKKWLYETRNNYTHNLYTTETFFAKGYYDLEGSWLIWEEIQKGKRSIRVSIKDEFKETLLQTVIKGMVNVINRF